MKLPRLLIFTIVLSIVLSACVPSASNGVSPERADLVMMADDASRSFLGDSVLQDGLLKQFKDKTGYTISVDYVGGADAETYKTSTLAKKSDEIHNTDIDVFIFDSSLFAAGLKDQKFVANTYVGPWIRKDVAQKIGWEPGSRHTMAEYATIMESGQLKIVAPNALQSVPGALSFFATLGSFYGPENTLTYEQVINPEAIQYGKRVYDNYTRSAGETKVAVDLVFKDSLEGKNNLDGVIAYESSFNAPDGLNYQLEKAGKQPFVFFYFSDASIKATLTMGRVDNLSAKEKEIYRSWSAFIDEEPSQLYIASQGVRPGGFGYEADPQVMKSNWGLSVNPGTTLISSPVYAVANQALSAYRDYYKRAKFVGICEDLSPSMDRDAGGISRLSALNNANLKITDPSWLNANRLTPGPRDVIQFYFFSGMTSDLIVQTNGPDTKPAGERLSHFIGNNDVDENNRILSQELGFVRNSTAIFNCANNVTDYIVNHYDPEVDYYVVAMTDGENVEGMTPEEFYKKWSSLGKSNITFIGISFGTDGSSVKSSYTSRFQGFTYSGSTESELVKAFQKVFGN